MSLDTARLDLIASASERNESSRSSQRSQSPVFMSPLLPPTTRSRSTSPDEIPGLGGLSSRHPLSPLPQFVAPTITARAVTEGSSWSIPGSGKELEELEQGNQKTMSATMKSNDGLAKSIDGNVGANDSNLSIVNVPSNHASEFAADGSSPPPSPRVEHTTEPPSSVVHPSPSTPPPTTQSQSQSLSRGSDYDDDSDMDFGTPVTSPVIIVPGPKVDAIDMLPPPVSPCPVSVVPKSKDMTPRAKTPRPETGAGAPNVVTPRAVAPATATPAVQAPRVMTPKPTHSLPITQQTWRTGLEERDVDSGFPSEMHESHIEEKDTEIQISGLHSPRATTVSVPALAQSSGAAQAVQETAIPPLPPISAPTLVSTTHVSRIPNSALLPTLALPTQPPSSTLLPLPSPTSPLTQTSAISTTELTSSNPLFAISLKNNAIVPSENEMQPPPSRHDQVRNQVQIIEQGISVTQPLPPPTRLRSQATVLEGATTHLPVQSTPPYEQEPDNAYSPRAHRQINSEMQQPSSQEQFGASLPDVRSVIWYTLNF